MNIEQILRDPQLRSGGTDDGDAARVFIQSRKAKYIEEADEERANHWAILDMVYSVQCDYAEVFRLIGIRKYYAAWRLLEQIEIAIKVILRLYVFVEDEYRIHFIRDYVRKIQGLFPYTHFGSSEIVYKEVRCSICDQVITLRKRCGHQKGALHMGELCHYIVTQSDFIGFSVVTSPVNKYSVLGVNDKEDSYKYPALDMLVRVTDHPFNQWEISRRKILKPHGDFRTGRNERCPCLSDRKYKHCCLLKAGVETDHIDIHLKQPTLRSGQVPRR